MANIKFSAFTNQAAADTTYLVGYDGTDNTNYTKAQIKTWLTTGNNAIPTLYSADGTLASARTITMDGNTLSMAQASGNTVTFSSLNNEGISIAGGFNYKIATGSGAFTIDSSTSSNSNAIVLQTNNGAGTNASILIDSRSPGANADLHLKTATKLKIDLPVAATVGYVLKADDTAGNVSWAAETDTDTTYAISAADGDATDEEKIVLTAGGSGSGTSTVVLEASTGLTVARSTDKITFTNSSPDQTVALTGGTGITTSGTYPNFTITNSAPDQTVALTGGTGITTSGTYPNFTITNDSPNQATPAAGSSGQLQYNDGSNGFAASSNLTFTGSGATPDTLTVQDNIVIKGDGSSDASKLKFNCYNNNHHVEIIGPDHAGSPVSYSIKLPNALPNVANQILESNASGTLSWIATPTDTDTSIYAANGSLTGARSVTMGTHNLTFASTTAGQEVKFGQNVRIDGQSYTPLETISSTNSWTPDWDSGNVQTMELTAATTINNPSNIEVGATYIIILKQDSTGSRTVTWGTQYKFPANTPPTLTTGANKADVITLVAYSSTVLMCTSVLDFATS